MPNLRDTRPTNELLDPPFDVAFEETAGEPTAFVVGLDLGKSKDFTAVAVNERIEAERIEHRKYKFQVPGKTEYARKRLLRHQLVRLHRYPLGMPYPEICRSIRDVMQQLPARPQPPDLIVDGTGVGKPICDAMCELGLQPVAITITGGFEINRKSRFDIRIPKRLLAATIDVVLSERRLKVAETDPLASVLVSELRNFHVKVPATGSETYENWRASDHDDWVLAVALAVWHSENKPRPTRMVRFSLVAER